MSGCDVRCWVSVSCPTCGCGLYPRGRSLPLEFTSSECCEAARNDPKVNPRHLWNEHDSTRHYTDPEGWAEHERNCKDCGEDA